MHIDYNDPVLWLSYRFACDVQARNKDIERKFLHFFDHIQQLHIVDVGAGTGANFRYYFDKIKQDQEWTFLEKDPHMIQSCHHCLEKFATDQNLQLEQTQDHAFTLTGNGKKARITMQQTDINKLEQEVDLDKTDVVTGNAFFDLVTYDHFDAFLNKLEKHDVCLMATLNYYETSFLPFSERDAQFLRMYHMHMKRPQRFGIAMGPDCSEEMLDLLAQHHMVIEQDGSQWHIGRNNTVMHHYMLQFIENAIHELNLVPDEQEAFLNWMNEKKKFCHDRSLEIYVDHSDIFAYPD